MSTRTFRIPEPTEGHRAADLEDALLAALVFIAGKLDLVRADLHGVRPERLVLSTFAVRLALIELDQISARLASAIQRRKAEL